jgi:hypothetical protein
MSDTGSYEPRVWVHFTKVHYNRIGDEIVSILVSSALKSLFGSSLPPVWGIMSYLNYLCLFTYSGDTHILCCVFVVVFVCLLCLVYTILNVSLDCPFLIALRFSLTLISARSRRKLTWSNSVMMINDGFPNYLSEMLFQV